ncbi:MAG: pyrimidine 5'-nucleotidase [Anaerolineales bacterium]|nr:pyrimidine 5'-nucleotidase [Chloroflexota bacterium]MBL6982695.1 pyrimidine 5'-nucleotidase [Anaerolineales bacterium]
MNLHTIFFDLDSTLYPESNGMWSNIRQRIDLYMFERLGMPLDEIPDLRHGYFVNYGTTLRGLQAHFGIDQQDYLDFVHDLPLEEYLQPEPQLRQTLLSIPHNRWIFTNSDIDHVERVLNKMQIQDCFDGVIDVWALDPFCKPQREAYQLALEIARAPGPQACVFLDDSISNLTPAHAAGFFTVLVGENGSHPAVDRSIPDIHTLRQGVPELWSQ